MGNKMIRKINHAPKEKLQHVSNQEHILPVLPMLLPPKAKNGKI
jgi:hypothetical protein